LRGTHGVSIASSAKRAMLSAPMLTAPRLRGIAEPGDEGVEHVTGILPWMAHRGGDHGLTLGVDRFVPVHHRRQHDARRVAMRDVEHGA
jgi:hypothetical protein